MIIAFQKLYQLESTGTLNVATWNKIKEVYQTIRNNLPTEILQYQDKIYPGRFLSLGMQGSDVTALQKMLNKSLYQDVLVTGCYDSKTENAIKQIQKILEIDETGVTGPLEWRYLVQQLNNH